MPTPRWRHHHPVVVVGAGWSGLAAAVTLAQADQSVVLLDAAPRAGGRAREVILPLAERKVSLDNGQHLLVGAYQESLRLLRQIGMPQEKLSRMPLMLSSTEGLRIRALPLPAPWHLLAGFLGARGLPAAHRWAMVGLIHRLRRNRWQAPSDNPTVDVWLRRMDQPDGLIRKLWAPICIATLNTDPAQACTRTFLRILRDVLDSEKAHSDFLLPAGTLGDLLPEPAIRMLTQHGADIRLRTTVTALQHLLPAPEPADEGLPEHDGKPSRQPRWRLQTSDGPLDARAVVLALPAWSQARLLSTLPDAATRYPGLARLGEFTHEPIITVYLAWDATRVPMLPQPTMLMEYPEAGAWGQWFFPRSPQQGLSLGSVVISTAGQIDADPIALKAGVVRQVSLQLGLPQPWDAALINEKRATFRCTPERPIVSTFTVDGRPLPWSHLMLAGDHAWSPYPATLESAVRSGVAAAQATLELDQRG